MTLITFYRAHGRYTGFSVIGHAGGGPYGEDIVCAGISAIAQTAANALISVGKAIPIVHVKEGILSVRLPRGLGTMSRYRAGIILATARQGFSDIAAAYPHHVRVTK